MGIFEESSNALQLNGELWEYQLVVYPDEPVNEKLIEERNRFYSKYDTRSQVQLKPHILIANFLAKEEMEATLLRWIQNICNLQSSFNVCLNNFGGFFARYSLPACTGCGAISETDGFFETD